MFLISTRSLGHSHDSVPLREAMCLRRKEKGTSKVLSRGFCLHRAEVKRRALRLLHIHCSNVYSYYSAPELNRPNP